MLKIFMDSEELKLISINSPSALMFSFFYGMHRQPIKASHMTRLNNESLSIYKSERLLLFRSLLNTMFKPLVISEHCW